MRALWLIATSSLIAAACSDASSSIDATANPDANADASVAADATPHPDATAGDAVVHPDASPADATAADASPGDVGPFDAGTGTGACAGRPCLEQVTTDAEFDALSRPSPHGACQFDRELLFIVPIDNTAPLQSAFYVNAGVHRHLLDFVRLDLGGQYAQIDVEAYFRAFEREDMRQYYTGRIRRLVPESGQPIRYGFELFGSGYFGFGGGPPEVELAAVLDRIRQTFTLPLGYAPGTYNGIQQAGGFPPVAYDVHLPATCPGESCAAGSGPCVIIPAGAELCGNFVENRSIQSEHARQTKLTLAPGNHRLAAGGTIPLFSGGVFGVGGEVVTPDGDARVVTQNVGGTTYWSLEQRVLAGGKAIDLSWSLWTPDRPTILREPFMSEVMVYGVIDSGMTSDDLIHLSSCTAAGLPLYFAEADLGNGDRVRMEYRHQLPFAGSGPLVPTGADVVLGGVSRRLDGYPNLLYAGVHHNWDNQFWLLFTPPIDAFGHAVHGLWIDEPGTQCCPVDGIYTLDDGHQALDTLNAASYQRSPAYF